MNKIIILGNFTRDVELKYTSSGTAIGKTGIANTRKFKSGDELKEEVLFVDLTFFGRTAEVANQYLGKGSQVLIEGRLKLEQWTAQDGTKRSKHSIVVEGMTMLGKKASACQVPTPADSAPADSTPADSTQPASVPAPATQPASVPAPATQPASVPADDEIPF